MTVQAMRYHLCMDDSLVCWKCGGSISELPLPLARLAECPACAADLHVCKLCEFYAKGVSKGCREPIADEVKEKERANFCGYFTPRPDAHVARDDTAARSARAELDSLFGVAEKSSGPAPESETEAARRKLDELFRSGSDKD